MNLIDSDSNAYETKAATEVWTKIKLGLQASENNSILFTSYYVKLPLWSHCKSNKLLYKGTTYKIDKYITFRAFQNTFNDISLLFLLNKI